MSDISSLHSSILEDDFENLCLDSPKKETEFIIPEIVITDYDEEIKAKQLDNNALFDEDENNKENSGPKEEKAEQENTATEKSINQSDISESKIEQGSPERNNSNIIDTQIDQMKTPARIPRNIKEAMTPVRRSARLANKMRSKFTS